MSGGTFDYKQHNIRDIYEHIECLLNNQGEAMELEKWESEYYPKGKYHETFELEIQEKFKEALKILKKAYIYAHRIDYYLAGDDGEESFLRRLKEELNNL